MDTRDSEDKLSRPMTRLTRRMSGKGSSFEATPRQPIKRTKRKKAQADAADAPTSVNGTKDGEPDFEDGESPSKKSRLDAQKAVFDKSAESKMDVEESSGDIQKNEDQEMDIEQDPFKVTDLPNIRKDALGDRNLNPRVVLDELYRPSLKTEDPNLMKSKKVSATPAPKAPAPPTKPVAQISGTGNRHDSSALKRSNMADYQRTMMLKAQSAASSSDLSKVNHLTPSVHPRRANNVPRKETIHSKESDKQKPVATKTRPRNSSRGFTWCLWGLVRLLVLLVLLVMVTLLIYKIVPLLQDMTRGGGQSSRAVKLVRFADQLSDLQTQFPSQRPELWRMSKIHLEKHLETAHPSEPVSLIFTAGQKAERTLQCLARGLAASFSSALNASFLDIDGKSKAGQDSDEVKLDIDSQLKAAFEGEKPVAIIHRLEELPPGSTLIFYRYCDHENAAYKRVFLLFSVLLPQDEIPKEKGVKEVEEMVQDYLKERLVDTGGQTSFNIMNNDKFGGLWSRISHLVLPVVSEVEEKGC